MHILVIKMELRTVALSTCLCVGTLSDASFKIKCWDVLDLELIFLSRTKSSVMSSFISSLLFHH